MAKIVVCDLGIGNLRSVVRALERSSAATITVETDALRLLEADVIVVPGQGAFRDGAAALARGFGEAIRNHVSAGRPYLGICLGMQLLFDTSDEAPGAAGLGIFPGHVARIQPVHANGKPSLKVPHIGWNTVNAPEPNDGTKGPTSALAPLFGKQVYFAHSFVAEPRDLTCVAATVDYGHKLVCAVARDNIVAVQFHPEKSQRAGLAFLDAWLGRLS